MIECKLIRLGRPTAWMQYRLFRSTSTISHIGGALLAKSKRLPATSINTS